MSRESPAHLVGAHAPWQPSRMQQETRRHRRLMRKAAKLDSRDLLDICAMRGVLGGSAAAPAAAAPGAAAASPAAEALPAASDAVAPALAASHVPDTDAADGAADEAVPSVDDEEVGPDDE